MCLHLILSQNFTSGNELPTTLTGQNSALSSHVCHGVILLVVKLHNSSDDEPIFLIAFLETGPTFWKTVSGSKLTGTEDGQSKVIDPGNTFIPLQLNAVDH